jgi:hypothetical protein
MGWPRFNGDALMNQVRNPPARALMLVTAVVLVVGVWTLASRRTHQQDLQQELEQQTVQPASPATTEIVSSTGRSQTGALSVNRGDDQEEPTQADITRARDEAIRKLESAFISEPMDPGWASAQMGNVNAALKPDALAQYGAIAPRNASVDCRSQHCRIVAVYDDMDQAELGQFALASGIGGTLPGTASFMLEQPDGSQRLVIYATAKPSGRPNGH